jgi:GntR family transcriptional regulator
MANGDAVTDSSPVFSPLYQQIKALLLQSLEQGEWNAGEMIPSEVDLALRYKVSQGTVRKAIDELTADNLLVRRQGRGTFVATHQEPVNRFRFLRMQKKDGSEFKTYSSVLAVETAVPPAEVRERLQMRPNQQATVISRLLSFGQEPAVFEYIWLPKEIFPDVTMEKLVNYKGGLYGWFEAEYNVRMIRAVEHLSANLASAEVARRLMVEPNSALLYIERVSYTYAEQPVEVRLGWYNTKYYHYRNELI